MEFGRCRQTDRAARIGELANGFRLNGVDDGAFDPMGREYVEDRVTSSADAAARRSVTERGTQSHYLALRPDDTYLKVAIREMIDRAVLCASVR